MSAAIYERKIKELQESSFLKIRQIAVNELSSYSEDERNVLYNSLERGTALLDSHELLCQYLSSYGKMHKSKVDEALNHIPIQIFEGKTIQIIDWGCGQGLAIICFCDYVREKGITCSINKAVLIEPAILTINRAKLHVEQYIDSNRILALPKFFNELEDSDIESTADITLHFFSNILDVEAVNIQDLAKRISNTISGEHYFVCIGPLNSNNRRIDSFFNWFNTPQLIWEAQHNKDQHNYTAKYKLFKIERYANQPILVPFNPPVQFHAAYQLDGIKQSQKTLKDKSDKIMNQLSDFEVSAPFDFGASIYEDTNPLFAVLNNIIVRGLPTKASPFIEKAFAKLGNTEIPNELGGINYGLDIDDRGVFLAMHAIDSRITFNDKTYNTDILNSDLEKEYILKTVHPVLTHILQPQRSLKSITNDNRDVARRVDFSIEYPYKSPQENGKITNGCVIELDGVQYHQNEQRIYDNERARRLNQANWDCIRINGNNINRFDINQIESDYIKTVLEAYQRPYSAEWVRELQCTLTPIAVARLEKTIIEALLINKLDIHQEHWNILVDEKDVPCAALAFADLQQMFLHISELSTDYSDYKLPQINLTVISNREFVSSPLHQLEETNGITVNVYESTTEAIKAKIYDLIIDIAVMRRSGIERTSFSDYKCKNQCYFNIRSAHYNRTDRYIYTSDVINYKPLVTKDSQGLYHPLDESKHLDYFLQLLFRKKSFRPGQLPILSRALQNKSVIGLLPTGGGKSLTYQIAAMLQPGVTVIIDPLRSLMKDQYDGLLKTGIDSCTFINSTISAQEKEERAKKMEESQMQFVFMSPERLGIYSFRKKLKNMHDLGVYFSYGVVDEVHCVSEWGHDFRFTYLHLGRNLYNYVLPKQRTERNHITLFGLTATASFDVLADVERELSGNGQFPLDSDCIVRDENTNRLELQYKIEKVHVEYQPDQYYDKNHTLDTDLPKAVKITDKWATYASKQSFLEKYIAQIPQYISDLQINESLKRIIENFYTRQNKEPESENDLFTPMPSDFATQKEKYEQAGIVFCPHKKNTGISVEENADSIANLMTVGTFMGSSDDNEEESKAIDEESFKNLELFRDNKLPLMIATKAFGMGIDKPNVRFTINMNYSSSLESFVQEAGRAGRDRHTALSIILLSDYHLVRISPKYQETQFPLLILKNRWFKKDDLPIILDRYNLNIPDEYIDHFTPERDMVRLRCEVCNIRFSYGKCMGSCDKCKKGPCQNKCAMYNHCQLRKVPEEARGFQYIEDIKEILNNKSLSISSKHFEYLNTDYETVMYFYNNNFKGSLIEKRTMYDLLSRSTTSVFRGDDTELKETYEVSDFLNELLCTEEGTELVAFISTKTIVRVNEQFAYLIHKTKENATIEYIKTGMIQVVPKNNVEIYREKSDVAKAIYRMCCIGMIDDFTEDYARNAYRVVAIRKTAGQYYKKLQKYLERYYSKAKAADEIKKVPKYKGENEIHKCLGYLTEFIYDKIAIKRKRSIDDIRAFSILGAQDKNWLELNEELKDFIYYYFNSKYARRDFEYPDLSGDDKFSLTTETDNGKESSFPIVMKYITVVDDVITSQDSSSQIDNIKHLQGAVRLIRRSLTDINPAIDLLNVFCLLYLGLNYNETLINEAKESFLDGYNGFFESYQNKDEFYSIIEQYKEELISRNINKDYIKLIENWSLEAELQRHNNWINTFRNNYSN